MDTEYEISHLRNTYIIINNHQFILIIQAFLVCRELFCVHYKLKIVHFQQMGFKEK